MSDKIKISIDDLNASNVDEAVKRQETLKRMGEHQQTVASNVTPQQRIQSGRGGFFRKAFVYMAIAGLIASLIGWGIGEALTYLESKNDLVQFREIIHYAQMMKKEGKTEEEINRFVEYLQSQPEYRNNSIVKMIDDNVDPDSQEFKNLVEKNEGIIKWLNRFWYIAVALCISIGLSVSESLVDQNWTKTLKNLGLGLILGCLGGFIVSLFVDDLYRFLQGDYIEEFSMVRQVFARTVGWGIIGMFVAIAPGITMWNMKKFFLGLLGGLIGGLFGGLMFDLICQLGNVNYAVVFARFLGIVAFGVLAGVATALLENVAKQGWLKIKAGLIAGKQFILYKNPTTIGSSPKCDVYLFKDPSVAGIHAAIHEQKGRYILCTQQGATTLINNVPSQESVLKNGDMIQIGSTLLLFETKQVQ